MVGNILGGFLIGIFIGVLIGSYITESAFQKNLIAANHATFVAEGANIEFVFRECK